MGINANDFKVITMGIGSGLVAAARLVLRFISRHEGARLPKRPLS